MNNRRRLIILNGLEDSSSHQQWDHVINQDFYLAHQDADTVRTAIDSILPATDTSLVSNVLSFEAWTTMHGLDNDPQADPDADGLNNLSEFYSGSDPTQPSEDRLRFQQQSDGKFQLRYPRANRVRAISGTLMSSKDLTSWTPYIAPQRAVIPLGLEQEEVILSLENAPTSFFRIELSESETDS